MQDAENSCDSITDICEKQNVYPEILKSYKVEIGGRMACLRDLNVEKVRNYHKEYYRASNLMLVISGEIEPLQVFESIKEMEMKIINDDKKYEVVNSKLFRPWSFDKELLTQENITPSSTHRIEFPGEEEESNGKVVISYNSNRMWDAFEYRYITPKPFLYVSMYIITITS